MADNSRKIVHDPIYGSITINGFFMDIMNRHEMQRIHMIKQLGLGNLVFPGANHTRFEHCMGVYHLAGRMSDAMDLSKKDKTTVMAAGLLHDICHAPYSHTLEERMEMITGRDHMELARDLLFGKIPTFMERDRDLFDGTEPISRILTDNGISAREVCDLIMNPQSKKKGPLESFDGFASDDDIKTREARDYIHQIIHGPVDADQMDYLLRDSHYTGVTYGTIDLDRLLSQIRCVSGKLALEKGGIVAAEGLMVSRSLMYSSVYYHKTVRIAEMMLDKAVGAALENGTDLSEIYLMTDTDLVAKLLSSGDVSSKLVRDIMYRRLYKKSYILYSNNLTDDDVVTLTKYSGFEQRNALADKIASLCDLDKSQVVVDIPSKSTLLSNIKIGKTDVLINNNGGPMRTVASYSPLAKSLQGRSIIDWSIMISAPDGCQEKVAKAARSILGIDDRVSL